MKMWSHLLFSLLNSSSEKGAGIALKSPGYEVDIRRTSFGIPHIRANDCESLAFGIGFAYAQDNIELLADAVLTARGERSAHFGAVATISTGSITNLESDLFSKFYFDVNELRDFYRRADPTAAAMMKAYANGVARYLSDVATDILPQPYREVYSGKPISAEDLYLLLAQKAVQTSGQAFAAAMVNAQPPLCDVDGLGGACATRIPEPDWCSAELGSNAYALGAELSHNGQGLLVGNPHFPWFGPSRFYQMHLTVPGELDVIGASLPPFPAINIGCNKDIAWTHTVSSSRQFAIYELELVPGRPLEYRFNGKVETMRPKTVSVLVKEEDGSETEVRRTLYASRFGPIIVNPTMGCVWSDNIAYSLCDLAHDNVGMVSQWLAINKSKSVSELKRALSSHRGALWLSTLAADRHGEVFFGNFSAVPDLPSKMRKAYAASPSAMKAAETLNIPILNGSRRNSILRSFGKALARPAFLPSKRMPSSIRRDYVLNSNDSHWLTNANHPLSGYSDLLGAEQCSQGFRTRMGHKELAVLIARKPKGVGPDDLKELVFSNRNYAGELVLDQLIALCQKSPRVPLADGQELDIEPASRILANWDRCDDVESRGAILFREFWRRAQVNEQIWKTPFDPAFPLTTPRDLNVDNPEIAEFLLKALADAVLALQGFGLPLEISVGEAQRFRTKDGVIPIPGGDGSAGVLNLIAFGALDKDGYAPVDIAGTSYTQVVSWEGDRVIADAILPFSQSSNIESPHYADQTKIFAVKGWIRLPFTEAEIANDPNLISFRLTE